MVRGRRDDAIGVLHGPGSASPSRASKSLQMVVSEVPEAAAEQATAALAALTVTSITIVA